jgi:hypothetical protein
VAVSVAFVFDSTTTQSLTVALHTANAVIGRALRHMLRLIADGARRFTEAHHLRWWASGRNRPCQPGARLLVSPPAGARARVVGQTRGDRRSFVAPSGRDPLRIRPVSRLRIGPVAGFVARSHAGNLKPRSTTAGNFGPRASALQRRCASSHDWRITVAADRSIERRRSRPPAPDSRSARSASTDESRSSWSTTGICRNPVSALANRSA